MKIFHIILGLLLPLSLSAQNINGKVTNARNEPLSHANVYWLGTTTAVSTDVKGEFTITSKNNTERKLVATFVGHIPDTIAVGQRQKVNFVLKETQSLEEVVVTGQRNGVHISDLKPIKVEQITTTELRKAACCDLAGCFDTHGSVQPQVTNVITNSKELRILGLSGVYNQVLIDGLPMIQGLSYTYGISSVPGTLVNSIHISKGANSVTQGYESISGQINVETKEPANAEKLFLNGYINSYSEKQFNAHATFKRGKWSSMAAFHTVQPANKTDKDKDNFLDLPLLSRYMFLNKWNYGDENHWGWHSRIGLRFLNENRVGGQMNYDSDAHKGGSSVYGNWVNLNQPEVWTKTGYRFSDHANLVFLSSAYYQKQKSYFGTVNYNAEQTNYYGNLQYELSYLKEHSLNAGISYRYMNLDENIVFGDNSLNRTYNGQYRKNENIAGLFAENTARFFEDRLTWIAGIRGDHHNDAGFIVTPRTLVKFDITPITILRANIGKGWRTVNIFSENIGMLASSRDIVISNDLSPEEAVNYGVNFTQKFGQNNEHFSGYLSTDYYHTDFQNQIISDYDADPTKVLIGNFDGTSISNGFQAELNLKIEKLYEFKVGYNFLDVFYNENGQKKILPFNSKHKVLTAFNFRSAKNRVLFDVNMHWFGKQHLPDTKANPLEYQRPDFSEPYTIVNTQLTYNFRKFEVYTGCENVFNFRQKQPIISWQNPFGPYFDTSSVWGPTRGREFYIGVRFKLVGSSK
jgi:outer membrane receptor for ferrienterochelin and colicin